MTKVLMIGWELPPHNTGGLGVACLGLAKALARKGAKVTFVMPKKCDVRYDFMDIVFADIDVEDGSELMQNSYASLSSWMRNYGIESNDPFPADFLRAAAKLARKMEVLAKKIDADVVHAHDWMTFDAGIVASKTLGVPLVVHIHNTVFDRGGGNGNSYEYDIEKRGFDHAERVVAVSEFTRDLVSEKYAIDANKIDVVYNGIDLPERKDLAPALSEMKALGYKIVLYHGRITLQKGPEYFIRAAKKVLEYDPKVLFIVSGSGDMQGYMMEEAVRLGIFDKVLFAGALWGDDRDRVFQSADVYVMPSVSEPFGIVPLESIANGTPAIISKQSGVSEILRNVLKVDFWDIDEMANKILGVLKYPAMGVDLRKESIKELPKINWDVAADKCMNIYSQLSM